MPDRRPRFPSARLHAVLLALACAVLLGACAPELVVRPPTQTQVEQAREGSQALVLIRIETVIDGKQASPTAAADGNRSVRIHAARMDLGAPPARVFPGALSEESAAAGWRYLMLAPGRYFFVVLPPGVEQNPPAVAYHAPSGKFGRLTQYRFDPGRGGFWAPEIMAFVLTREAPADFHPLPGYWLDVPAGQPVVYAGSLRVTCTNGRGLGGLMDSCSEFEARDDSADAARVAGAIPSLGSPLASLLVPYGRPGGAVDAATLGNLSVRMTAWQPVRAAYPLAKLESWGVVHGSERPVLIFNLLAIAVHALGQAAAGAQSEKLAQAAAPCMQALSQGLAQFDGETPFARGLRASLPEAAYAAARPEGPRLVVEPSGLQLRESAKAGHLALELGLHVRLETGAPPRVAYESRHVYAEPFPTENPLGRTRLYERLTAERPTAHPIDRWCGPEGLALLEGELQRGLAAIAAQVARDLK